MRTPIGGLVCNPAMCPEWESNWRPFGLQSPASFCLCLIKHIFPPRSVYTRILRSELQCLSATLLAQFSKFTRAFSYIATGGHYIQLKKTNFWSNCTLKDWLNLCYLKIEKEKKKIWAPSKGFSIFIILAWICWYSNTVELTLKAFPNSYIKKAFLPWLVWSRGLGVILQPKRSWIWFPVRAHAWVGG